ncbi:MAG TPA: glycoside hydrolase family 43 protein [Acidimicrobiales bacterium]|jgi:beta-xylosidase|nr:glycoside hydrolase family 43 protein [Acidimicrobiales bacterium]
MPSPLTDHNIGCSTSNDPFAVTSLSAPVYAGDFPDPAVVAVGSTYFAYATGSAGRNLQVTQASDLSHWSSPVDPLPTLPGWATRGYTWAPGVTDIGGTFVMYYTARDTAAGRQCISVATSSTPQGPFTDTSTAPLIGQLPDGGSIDPNPFNDSTGARYLIWKSDDNAIGQPTRLWGQRLSADGRTTAGTPTLLLTESASWQAPTVEGPTVVAHGGQYYLFYGANNYDTANSGIGCATSSAVLGAYTNHSTTGAWLGSRGNAQGPQGPSIFTDTAGNTRMAFAAWYGTVGYEHGGVRSLWVATLTFSWSGKPSLS